MAVRKLTAAAVVCLLAGLSAGGVKMYGMRQPAAGLRHSAGPIAAPSPAEQANVLAAARCYTDLWLAGRYAEMYPLVSPRANCYLRGNRERFVRRLVRQRQFPAYRVPATAGLASLRLVSVPWLGVAEFFVAALDEQPLRQFMTGRWPGWSRGDIAVTEFSLQGKRYRQVWERTSSGQWKCLSLPLDLDDATAGEMHLDDFAFWNRNLKSSPET